MKEQNEDWAKFGDTLSDKVAKTRCDCCEEQEEELYNVDHEWICTKCKNINTEEENE